MGDTYIGVTDMLMFNPIHIEDGDWKDLDEIKVKEPSTKDIERLIRLMRYTNVKISRTIACCDEWF